MSGAMLTGPASAQVVSQVECGDTISTPGVHEVDPDGQLSHAGNSPCITITASDVVLDGNGQTITGEAEVDTGIEVDGTDQSNVTVRNLEVTDFWQGVSLNAVGADDTEKSLLEDVIVRGASTAGIDVAYSNVDIVGVEVDNSGLESPGDGIVFDGASEYNVSIEDTVVQHARTGVESSESGLETDGLTVASNLEVGLRIDQPDQVHTNLTAVSNSQGVRIYGGEAADAHHVTIRGSNTETSDNGGGVDVDSSHNVTIEGPGVSIDANDRRGISVSQSDDVTISGVSLDANGDYGLDVRDSGNVDVRNVVVEGGEGVRVVGTNDPVFQNVDVSGSSVSGVRAVGTDLTIRGSDTRIVDNDGEGVLLVGCTEGTCADSTADIRDATITGNRNGDLLARPVTVEGSTFDATIDATNVNVGASTAADTTVDAELRGTYLTSLASLESSVSDSPEGQEALDRYVLLASTVESGGYADVTLHYADGDVDGLNESTVSMLSMGFNEDTTWDPVTATLDEGANTVSTNVTSPSFAGYGLFAEPAPEPTPTPGAGPADDSESGTMPLFNIEDVDAPDEVEPGEAVPLDVTVANDGDADGVHNVTVRHDGEVVAFQRVSVDAGENHTISLSPVLEEEGEYEMDVSNQTAVTVTAALQDQATESPTPTATETRTEEPTQTEAPAPGPTETPEDDGGGLPVLPIVAVLVIVAIGAGAVWWSRQ